MHLFVCCGVLQSVVVYYNALQHCSVAQCVAVYYSVLQCVTVCSSVLQCFAVFCKQCVAVCCSVILKSLFLKKFVCIVNSVSNTLFASWIQCDALVCVVQCVAVWCIVLQCVLVCQSHYGMLQRVAAHCNTLQCGTYVMDPFFNKSTKDTLQHTAAHCSTLQHTAAHCSTLQHTAAHCSTLQHTAAHCSTLQCGTWDRTLFNNKSRN